MRADNGVDRVNRRAWKNRESVAGYQASSGWSDAGEKKAIELIAPQATGKAILDIGVGGGRTIALLLPISTQYIGIDYTPELLEACRNRYPGTTLFQMDARNLSAFSDGAFSLVVFSFNGIDSVSADDRVRILKEIHRVLVPGGLVLFSTHNKSGPLCGQGLVSLLPPLRRNPLTFGRGVMAALQGLPAALANYFRHARLESAGDGWCMKRAAAHRFGIVITYTDLETQQRQLQALGFQVEAVFGDTGRAVTVPSDTGDIAWFQIIARKGGADIQSGDA